MNKIEIKQKYISISNILFRQADYCRSSAGFETAKNIISEKIRNCIYILTRYRQGLKRARSPILNQLLLAQISLTRLRKKIIEVNTQKELFLLEAYAGRIYWRIFGKLCKQNSDWKRVYPKAKDNLNLLLNAGYVALSRKSKQALEKANLLAEGGVLHNAVPYPLAYDFMECFRQVSVDSVVIPILSRKKKFGIILEKDKKRFFWKLKENFKKKFLYNGRFETLENIMKRETVLLREAILSDKSWFPFKFKWGNSINKKAAIKDNG